MCDENSDYSILLMDTGIKKIMKKQKNFKKIIKFENEEK